MMETSMTETTETPALVEVTQADRKLLNEIERFAFVAGQEALISDDALDVIARHRLAAERTPSTVAPDAGLVGWRYEINYGPEGETNYANVYDGRGEFVGNLKVHHAIALTAPAPADAAEREAERGWQPIESAPWDGTPILGYHPDYGQRETLMEHYRDGTIGFAQHGPA